LLTRFSSDGDTHSWLKSTPASHDVGEGPYLDAVTLGLTFYADELGDESRWPLWYSLICPLTDSDTPGSIEGDKSLQVRGEPVAV
jgi:hypothetical protein